MRINPDPGTCAEDHTGAAACSVCGWDKYEFDEPDTDPLLEAVRELSAENNRGWTEVARLRHSLRIWSLLLPALLLFVFGAGIIIGVFG